MADNVAMSLHDNGIIFNHNKLLSLLESENGDKMNAFDMC